jgi:hypothetical protein
MKKIWREVYMWVITIDATSVGLVLFLLALAMFVVAAGAPEAGGTSVR